MSDRSQYRRARSHYVRHDYTPTRSAEFLKWQTKSGGSGWARDWGQADRDVQAQIAFARFIANDMPPDAVGVLYTPERLWREEFERRVRLWRNKSARLYPVGHGLRRRERRIEYLLSLEYGLHPAHSSWGRLHGHVLIWNLRQIPLASLAQVWRDLNSIYNPAEPFLDYYRGGQGGVGYCLKGLGSSVDMISFSPNLGRPRV